MEPNRKVVYMSDFKDKTETAIKASTPVITTGATALITYQLALNLTLIVLISSAVFLISVSLLLYSEVKTQNRRLENIYQSSLDDRKIFKEEIYRLNNKLFANLSHEVPYGAFELYLKYRSLNLTDFVEIASSTSKIHTIVYAIVHDIDAHNGDYYSKLEDIRSDDYMESYYIRLKSAVSENLKSCSEKDIYISQVHTGESIKFEFKSGWLPSYRSEGGDIIIESPKPLASVLFTGYLVSATINHGISTYNDFLEAEKKSLEIEKLQYELREFEVKAEQSESEKLKLLDKELKKLAKNTIRNHEIKGAKVTVGEPNKRVN